MPITIGSNIASLNAQRLLDRANTTLSSTYERLSTGLRINRASDDAAGLAISATLGSDVRVFTQAIRNVNDGLSVLNIAQGGLEQFSSIVTRIKELSEQAANGTFSLEQRKSMHVEAKALVDEFNRIVQTTKFNGQQIFNYSNGQLVIQAGAGPSTTIAIDQNALLAANVGAVTFKSAVTYGGYNTQDIAINDLNGDGINDIAISGGSPSVLGILLGNSDGTFRAITTYTAGGSGQNRSLTAADVNGDGKMDFILGSQNSASFTVFTGRGDGTFNTAVSYQSGNAAETRFVTAGDLNGDGFIDIVSTDATSNSYSINYGNGNGTFRAAATTFLMGANSPYRPQLADLNNDGRLDILVNDGSGAINVVLNQGNGSFATPKSYAVTLNSANAVIADFNQDGFLDVAKGSFGVTSINIAFGNGDGSFTAATTYAGLGAPAYVAGGDMNGDGIIDIVNSGGAGIEVRLGNGDGTFRYSATTTMPGNSNLAITLGDTNNDGVLDIVTDRVGVDGVAVTQQNANKSTFLPYVYLLSQSGARSALDTMSSALERITSQIGSIGASQSRLQTAVNTLSIARENYSSAYSRITDADLAEESSVLIRSQILQKSATAILAQANQVPSLAVQLLKG